MTAEEEHDADRILMRHLVRLHEDHDKRHDVTARGKLANLRFGMRDRLHADYPVGRVFPALGPGGMTENEERNEWRTLIAGLFGFAHDDLEDKRGVSLGTALRDLYEARQNDSLERRLMALLNADAEHLPGHLRQAISLLKTVDNCKLDWGMLLEDVSAWNSSDKWVQKKWTRDYYRSRKDDKSSAPEPAQTPEPNSTI